MDKQKHCKQTVGKLRMDFIPPKSLIAISKVREFGVAKYKDAWAWKQVVTQDELITAIQRHTLKIQLGEQLDDESGLPHTWHIACTAAMITELDERTGQNLLKVKHNLEK